MVRRVCSTDFARGRNRPARRLPSLKSTWIELVSSRSKINSHLPSPTSRELLRKWNRSRIGSGEALSNNNSCFAFRLCASPSCGPATPCRRAISVAQAFQPAGSRNFPVPGSTSRPELGTGDWGLESPHNPQAGKPALRATTRRCAPGVSRILKIVSAEASPRRHLLRWKRLRGQRGKLDGPPRLIITLNFPGGHDPG